MTNLANFQTFPCHFDQRRGSKRKRKKHLITELKKQVSFYFSDSNLSKDKFLRDIIQQDVNGYVSIKLIGSFNKILEISNDEKLLLRAISEISWLQFSADELSVRRSTPINYLYCADDRTIYIENLPPRIEHKKLEHALSKFGPISHISLPRFKKNKEFKGFGFVEFINCKDADKALKALGWNDPDSCLPKPPSSLEVPPTPLNLGKLVMSSPTTPTTPSTLTTPFLSEGARLESGVVDDSDVHRAKKRKRCRRSSFCVSDLQSDKSSLNSATPKSAADPLQPELKRKRTSCSPVNHKMMRKSLDESEVSDHSTVDTRSRRKSESEQSDKKRSEVESGTELKKKMMIIRKKRRKKKKLRLREQVSLQDIRVFPKLKWLQLKTLYKRIQKKQIAVVKGDLGRIAPPTATNRLVKLINVPEEYRSDDIKGLFQGAVSVIELEDQTAYVKFSTNSDILSSISLPAPISIASISTEEEALYLSKIAAQRRLRYVDSKKKKKRGYNKVIRKCSELDQTASDIKELTH